MRIGIFDSGLGGLFVLKELRKKLPRYDYLYLGDTKNLPYGDKSQTEIFNLTKKAVEYLFQQNCSLVIVACNTSSSQALRKIQQDWLPKTKYKNRRVLGIIRPTVEAVKNLHTVGIIGTRRTIDSGAYSRELKNMGWTGELLLKATPKLVPMIEANKLDQQILKNHLEPFKKADALILACTHYPIIKKPIQKILGQKVKTISPDEILPSRLRSYLTRHPEISQKLTRNGKITLSITKLNPHYQFLAKKWFGKAMKLKLIKY